MSILLFWILMFVLSGFFINYSLLMNVTVNNYLSFSYPLAFELDGIYVNEQQNEESIHTNSNFQRPLRIQFSNYKSLEGKFSFNYPSLFELVQKDFAGSDILYHIDLRNKSENTHGFVQVWNMPYSLEEFLSKSKSASQQNYKFFMSKPVTVNTMPGYYWDYSVMGSDGKYYKGMEVFLKKENFMYRISYFVPEAQWNKSQYNIFWNMVNSFKTN